MSRSLKARIFALALLITPALASAQAADPLSNPLTIRWSGDLINNTHSFNAGDCTTSLTLTWTYAGTTALFTTPLSLWATTATSCPSAPSSTDVTYTPFPQALVVTTQRSGTFTVPISTLPIFTTSDGDGGVTHFCGEQGVQLTQKICGAITPQAFTYTTTATPTQASELNLSYDTQPPDAPSISDVGSLDSSAVVNFTFTSADTATVYAQYSVAGLDAGDVWADGPSVTVANSTKLTITGLTNTVLYDIQLFAVDGAGNVSTASAVAQVEPLHTVGFFETLRNDGGTETGGGCAISGSMLVPLAALGLLRALARRSR
jgi:hypothetical protein